jgi:cation:H+ antiporter
MIIALLAGGLVLLILGAEMVVRGASRLAAAVGISPLIVGLTVVAFGTSAPELAVSLQSALAGQADIALGNVVGSNIFNILVILGLSAAVAPLVVAQQLVRLDVLLMIGASVLVLVLGLDGRISRLEGGLMFAGLVIYILFLIRKSRQESPEIKDEYQKEFGLERSSGLTAWLINVGLVAGGLGMLVLGSRWLVDGSVSLARAFGLSQLIIGLTVIAAGTSLPEVATSVIAVTRGERDIAAGNAVGSSIFNILSVLGLTSLAAANGVPVPAPALTFDIPVMIAVAVAALPVFFTGNVIARWEGWLFLGYYAIYTTYLVLDATEHDVLPAFSTVMLAFVVPLTVLTLLVLMVRDIRAGQGLKRSTSA